MLDREIDDLEIVKGLAHVFDLHAGEVSLVDEIAEGIQGLDGGLPVVIERIQLSGDFPLQLSIYIYLRRSDLELRVYDAADEQAMIARLCAMWKCNALFSDDDVNPYRWLLMSATGRLDEVTVDADRLDNEDAFVITRVNRMVRQVPVAVCTAWTIGCMN
jgi:hypothetical protein